MTSLYSTLVRSWSQHLWTNLATLCVLFLSFMILGSFLLLSKNISSLFYLWEEEIQISAYLKDGLTPDETEEIKKRITSETGVTEVTYINKAEAMKRIEASIASYGSKFVESVGIGDESPFPASFQIQTDRNYRASQKIETIAKFVETLPGVEEVSYGQDWISSYSALQNGLKIGFGIIAFVLLLGSIFSVGNAIRASQATRKEEIEIYELIGATNSMIRKPFIIEGAMFGVASVGAALFSLYVIFALLMTVLEKSLFASGAVERLSFFPWYAVIAFILVGSAVGALGSYFCISRINTGWAAAGGGYSK